MTKQEFKVELTLRLLDSALVEKNVGTKDDPIYELDAENLINHLNLIRQIADTTFEDEA